MGSTWSVVDMSRKPVEKDLSSPPILTEELARELMREGGEASREYRARVEQMWTISQDARRIRTR
jgi:uncharacterized protein YneF (UPF0154 family)